MTDLGPPNQIRRQCPRYPEMCSGSNCLSCYLEWTQSRISALEAQYARLRVRDDTTPEPSHKLPPELKVQFECDCHGCDNAAEQTEFSPYMDDFCHECTMRRCDVVGHGPVGDVTTPSVLPSTP